MRCTSCDGLWPGSFRPVSQPLCPCAPADCCVLHVACHVLSSPGRDRVLQQQDLPACDPAQRHPAAHLLRGAAGVGGVRKVGWGKALADRGVAGGGRARSTCTAHGPPSLARACMAVTKGRTPSLAARQRQTRTTPQVDRVGLAQAGGPRVLPPGLVVRDAGGAARWGQRSNLTLTRDAPRP